MTKKNERVSLEGMHKRDNISVVQKVVEVILGVFITLALIYLAYLLITGQDFSIMFFGLFRKMQTGEDLFTITTRKVKVPSRVRRGHTERAFISFIQACFIVLIAVLFVALVAYVFG